MTLTRALALGAALALPVVADKLDDNAINFTFGLADRVSARTFEATQEAVNGQFSIMFDVTNNKWDLTTNTIEIHDNVTDVPQTVSYNEAQGDFFQFSRDGTHLEIGIRSPITGARLVTDFPVPTGLVGRTTPFMVTETFYEQNPRRVSFVPGTQTVTQGNKTGGAVGRLIP